MSRPKQGRFALCNLVCLWTRSCLHPARRARSVTRAPFSLALSGRSRFDRPLPHQLICVPERSSPYRRIASDLGSSPWSVPLLVSASTSAFSAVQRRLVLASSSTPRSSLPIFVRVSDTHFSYARSTRARSWLLFPSAIFSLHRPTHRPPAAIRQSAPFRISQCSARGYIHHRLQQFPQHRRRTSRHRSTGCASCRRDALSQQPLSCLIAHPSSSPYIHHDGISSAQVYAWCAQR